MKQVADFQDAIQSELAWRKHEISAIKLSAVRAKETASHVFRSGQIILCAHWEGFLKCSTRM
ncbi:hypothetical protein KDH83_32135, partial [Achromobacter sp. Marseille-Q0513]|uniref:MAE_28990/MAE_18760 family HEPN-like nuclease n=1 Tax=Achromobacter sp. Marseille-Q0513 TaxID=2829161 RepID=UPI001B90473D